MKIGILTFHAAFNYGSMLQAWALQTVLTDMGHDVEIINFRSPRQKQMYRKPFATISLKYLIGDFAKLCKLGFKYLTLRKRWNKFDEFMKSNMFLTKEYDEKRWIEENKNYDIIITGSDQIWNVKAYDFSEVYLGKGIDPGIRLIAYAPSLGPNLELINKKTLFNYLNSYHSVSVREEGARYYIQHLHIIPEISKVLDPTMLLTSDEYCMLINNTLSTDDKYIYYYTPGNHPDIAKKAKEIALKNSLPILIDNGYTRNLISSEKNSIRDAGPKDFLSYIVNSKLVIGASFHLIVFAILFRKDFICIVKDNDERMLNLLKNLGLEDRIQKIGDDIKELYNPISWDIVDSRLSILRQESLNFLNNSLSK